MEVNESIPKIELAPFQGFTEDPPTTQLEDGRRIHWNAPLFGPLTLRDMAPPGEMMDRWKGEAVEVGLPQASKVDEAPTVEQSTACVRCIRVDDVAQHKSVSFDVYDPLVMNAAKTSVEVEREAPLPPAYLKAVNALDRGLAAHGTRQ
jgi:hypothetical protein